jgi:hypothetical protein
MYRCEPCKAKCRGSMRRHIIRRPDNSIAREVPVCQRCLGHLTEGMSYGFLLKYIQKEVTKRESVVIEIAPQLASNERPAPPVVLKTTKKKSVLRTFADIAKQR